MKKLAQLQQWRQNRSKFLMHWIWFCYKEVTSYETRQPGVDIIKKLWRGIITRVSLIPFKTWCRPLPIRLLLSLEETSCCNAKIFNKISSSACFMKQHGFADNDCQPIVAELVLCLKILSNHRTKQHSLQQTHNVYCPVYLNAAV